MNFTQSTNNNNTIYHHDNQKGCAACRHQHKKCSPDCILAPYFPHGSEPEFLNAHKLYGVRNMTKIVEKFSIEERNIAMQSIIFESDMRAANPVGGCCGMINELTAQIQYYKAQIEHIYQQLVIIRAQTTCHNGHLTDYYTSSVCDPNHYITPVVPSSVSNYQCSQPPQLAPIDNTMVIVNNEDVEDGIIGNDDVNCLNWQDFISSSSSLLSSLLQNKERWA